MHTDFLSLAAPGVRAISPYQPGKPVSELEREYGITHAIKLASNENPLGASSRAVEAVRAAAGDLARYPDGNGFALKSALAAHHGVDTGQLTLGNGSNDILELIARAFLVPGAEAVYSAHAFAVYPLATLAAGGSGVEVAAAPGWGHDLDAMRAAVNARTRIVFVANPNNPTGTGHGSAELEAFLAALPQEVVVVVDEAYHEYASDLWRGEGDFPDASRWLQRHPNLVVTRTFSKLYGLAALRVGYALSHPQVADLLNRVRQPFNVNAPAQAAALAALGDPAHVEASLRCNRDGMRYLETELTALGLDCIPSLGNFLSFDTGRDAGAVYQALLAKGVIVRPIANYAMPGFLRVTVGTESENVRFVSALKEVVDVL